MLLALLLPACTGNKTPDGSADSTGEDDTGDPLPLPTERCGHTPATDLDPSDDVVAVDLTQAPFEWEPGTGTMRTGGLAMDGAARMIDMVPAGGSFTYEIPMVDAGFYWYHPHMATEQGLERGLYGRIIVHHPDEPVSPLLVILPVPATPPTRPRACPSGAAGSARAPTSRGAPARS